MSKTRLVLDSDKNHADTFLKLAIGVLLVPFIAMLCFGALANTHPEIFGKLKVMGYGDWVLLYIGLGIIKSGKVSKWYLKTEKK